jgi:hypothetical protein
MLRSQSPPSTEEVLTLLALLLALLALLSLHAEITELSLLGGGTQFSCFTGTKVQILTYVAAIHCKASHAVLAADTFFSLF